MLPSLASLVESRSTQRAVNAGSRMFSMQLSSSRSLRNRRFKESHACVCRLLSGYLCSADEYCANHLSLSSPRHHTLPMSLLSFLVMCDVIAMFDARATGATLRERERRQRSWWRHWQLSAAAAFATAPPTTATTRMWKTKVVECEGREKVEYEKKQRNSKHISNIDQTPHNLHGFGELGRSHQ